MLPITFEELRQAYEGHMLGLQRNPHTIYLFRHWSAEFVHLCLTRFELTDPRLLQQRHIVAYVQEMQARGLAAFTIYNRQRGLRTWLRWALQRGHLFLDPCQDFHWKYPGMPPRGTPTEAQVRAVLEATSPHTWRGRRDRALFEFFYGTGVRSAECLAIDLDHLCLKTLQVRVIHGKGRRQRVLPVGPRLAHLLQIYLDEVRPQVARPETDALWVSHHGARLRRQELDTALQIYVLDLGFKLQVSSFVSPCSRYPHATRGASLVIVQRLLGHVNAQMTTRYTHLVPADLQEELLRTHPRGRRRSPKPAK